MEHFTPGRWRSFKEALRRHWPNLTDEELDGTQGDYHRLEDLIEDKLNGEPSRVRETLAFLYDEVQQGNPESVDDFGGIERAKSGGPPPDSNEWMAREDQNNPEIGY